MKKLAIITTHPIQYYAPIFKLLHERKQIAIRVFYTWGEKAAGKFDPGFNKIVEWDIPILEGYPFEWVENISKQPGSHHFDGIVNPGLVNQLNKWDADALLVFGWSYHGHLKALRHFHNKIPVFFRGDSTLLNVKPGLKALIKTLYLKWIYKHVDNAFYVGTNNKAYFKKYGLKDAQLSFAPHAIDNKRFAADKKNEADALRRQLGIDDNDILIMFAGKLEDVKAPELLLKAFIKLNRANTHLLFVGNGLLEKQLRENSKNFPNIHFIDFQNQSAMPATYQACDLFCLISVSETWGLAINEAMACGKAVVVSDKVGCAVDLVKSNYNGLIFESGNVEELSFCLDKLTKSRALLFEYGQHSSEIIKSWSFEAIAEKIEDRLIMKKVLLTQKY